jgi:superfamily II DNA or RNA helicase
MSAEPVPIAVDSRIRIPLSRLTEKAAEELRQEFTHDNPDHEREKRRLKAGGYRRKGPPIPDKIRTWREEGEDLTLPRGGLSRAREILKEHGVAFALIDRRTEGTGPRPSAGLKLAPHIDPYPFQIEMCETGARVQNCILRGAAGSGKTIVAEMLVMRLGLCTLVLVPTTKIFDQWKTRLVEELGLRPDDIGSIDGRKPKIKPITLAMVQTFAKHVDKFRGVFGALIFDEVHRAAAKTFYPAVDGSDAKYRIGVSDDEHRKDRKEFMIYDVFGRVAYETERRKLIEQGVIMDTEVRLVPTKFEAPWFAELDNEQKQNDRIYTRLLEEMVNNRERNLLAVSLIVASMREGHPTLAFSHRVEHCLSMRADVVAEDPRVGVVVGDDDLQRESDETLAGLKAGTILAAVGTYQSIGTGVDVPAVSRGVAVTPIYTNRAFFKQVRGRVCRVDRKKGAKKHDSILYVLWDRAVHGLVPLRNYLRFNGGNVTVLDPDTGAIEHGRSYLKRAEAEEDAEAAKNAEIF